MISVAIKPERNDLTELPLNISLLVGKRIVTTNVSIHVLPLHKALSLLGLNLVKASA